MMSKNKNDILGLLYLISKAEEGFLYRIRLQKMILLGKVEFGFPFSFAFRPHYYGPYSSDLQELIDILILKGLLKEELKEIDEETTGSLYSLTDRGKVYLEKHPFDAENRNKIDQLWNKYHTENTDILVKNAKEKSGIGGLYE